MSNLLKPIKPLTFKNMLERYRKLKALYGITTAHYYMIDIIHKGDDDFRLRVNRYYKVRQLIKNKPKS